MSIDIKSLLMNRPSLVDYMGGGKTGASAWPRTNLGATTQNTQGATVTAANGDMVSLSPEAQKLMAQAKARAGGSSKAAPQAQQEGYAFFLKFLKDSGIDLDKISKEAAGLVSGIREMIVDTGATSRDMTLDAKADTAQRKVFTLAGQDRRLSFVVNYGSDGKPAKLSVIDNQGSKATTANFTITQKNGKPETIAVERVSKTYSRFGGLTGTSVGAPLSIKL